MLLESENKYALLVEPSRCHQQTATDLNWEDHTKYINELKAN